MTHENTVYEEEGDDVDIQSFFVVVGDVLIGDFSYDKYSDEDEDDEDFKVFYRYVEEECPENQDNADFI